MAAPPGVADALQRAADRAQRLKALSEAAPAQGEGRKALKNGDAKGAQEPTSSASSTPSSASPTPSTGGVSNATTIPGTDQEAMQNALKGLAISSPPVTPQDRIRRTQSGVLPGRVGDEPILADGKATLSAESTTKQKKTKPGKKQKTSGKGIKKTIKPTKKPKGRGQKKAKTAKATAKQLAVMAQSLKQDGPKVPPEVPPEVPPQDSHVPGSQASLASQPPPVKATAAKQAPKPKPAVNDQKPQVLQLVKREKVEPAGTPLAGLPNTTPASEPRAKAVEATQEESLRRCNTQQQLSRAVASPQAADAVAPQGSQTQAVAQTTAPAPGSQTPVVVAQPTNVATPAPALGKKLAIQHAVDTMLSPPPGMAATDTAEPHEEPTQTEGRPKKREKTVEQKQLHARYMRFSRSIRSPRTPEEIRKAGRAAAYCHEKLQILQDAWTSCKGEWKKSSLFLSIRHRKKCSTHGARVWLTRAQICAKYGGDQAVADDICNNKLMDPELAQSHVKSHPDAPNSEAMKLFLVWDSEGISETEDTVVQSLFEAIDSEGDSDDGKKGKKRKSKKDKDSSDSSSDGDESSDKSSESGDKKKKKKNKKSKGKGKKNKKETDDQKKKRLQREEEKRKKEEKQKADKAEKEMFAKGRKILNSINPKIGSASKKLQVINAMCPALRNAIQDDFQSLWQNMVDERDKLQHNVDMLDAVDLDENMASCSNAEKEYTDFLTRANLK